MFGLEEARNKTGIGSVAFVTPELLHSESLDALGIYQMNGGGRHLMQSLGDGIAIVTGLFETGMELARRVDF